MMQHHHRCNLVLQQTFPKKNEELLLSMIFQRIDLNEMVTDKEIARLALEVYYSPLSIAIKEVVNSSLLNKVWPFDDDYGIIVIENFEKKLLFYWIWRLIHRIN